VLKPEN